MKIADKCRTCPFFPTEEELDEGINYEAKYRRPYIHKCGGVFKRLHYFNYEFGFNDNCSLNSKESSKEINVFLNKYGLDENKIHKEEKI